jgi:hypothetical protein
MRTPACPDGHSRARPARPGGPRGPAGGPAGSPPPAGDGVLGGDRVGQDGGVQHPPTSSLEHPGLLYHLTDRLEDPSGPRRAADAVAPIHQHGGMEASSSRRSPQATFQAISRRSALMASRSLRPSKACSTITVATTSAGTDEWPPPCRTTSVNSSDGNSWWRWSARKAYTDPSGTRWRHQLAASIWASEAWRAGLMSPAVCPLPAPSANHRIDPTSQIDRNDRTTPAQQAPRRRWHDRRRRGGGLAWDPGRLRHGRACRGRRLDPAPAHPRRRSPETLCAWLTPRWRCSGRRRWLAALVGPPG